MTATLRFDVVSNGSGARRDLSQTRREVEQFGRSTERAGSQSERSRSKVSRFGGAIGSAAKLAGGFAIAAGTAAVVKFGVDSVRAASDVEQSMGAVDAVFDRNADKVKAWASSAVNDVGLAKSEYAQLSATLGAGLKNSGLDDYTGKTRTLIKTAADLSAQFGGSTSQAVEALGSLMRGEADPIERYGVSIKQSDVNAQLAARGQDKLTGAHRKAAEAQARLDLLAKQTTTSQGAFRRESSTLAGQQQRLAANFENVKAKLGSAVIPYMARGLSAVNKMFSGSGKLSGATSALGRVYGSYLRPILGAVRGAVDTVRNAFSSAGGKGDGLRKAAEGIGRVAKFIAPILGKTLAGAITLIAKGIGTAIAVVDRLASAFAKVVDWVQKAFDKIGQIASKVKSVGSLGGILRTGDPSQTGLARAAGAGYLGGAGYAPTITLESRPSVVIDVDSPAMARLFRVIVRDELSKLVRPGSAVV